MRRIEGVLEVAKTRVLVARARNSRAILFSLRSRLNQELIRSKILLDHSRKLARKRVASRGGEQEYPHPRDHWDADNRHHN